MPIGNLVFFAFVAFAVVTIAKGFVVVRQGMEYTVERFGKYRTTFTPGPHWMVPPSFGDGPATEAAARENHIEGVMAKRSDSVYLPGRRSADWIKIKFDRTGDYVIGGWRPGARKLGGLLVGVPTPDMRIPDLPLIDVFGRGGALKSSWYGDCLPSRDFPMLVDLYLQGRLDLDAFVSEEIGIDDVEAAFERMERGDVLRSVVTV